MASVSADLILDVSEALAQIDALSADLDAATQNVDVSLDVEPVEVEIAADVDAVQAEIDSIEAEGVEVPVEAPGAAEASAEIEELGGAAEGAGVDMSALSDSTASFGAVAGVAGGSAEGLLGVLGGLGPGGVAAAAGVGALALTTQQLFSAAVESVGSTQRFDQVLGGFASTVDSIQLGELSLSLEEFAVMIGQDDEALRNAATTIFNFGKTSGAAGEDVAAFTEDVILLAGRATLINPALGDAGSAAGRLQQALGRGGRATARFGIDLTTAEINARALADTGKESAAELTNFEKQAAGAALATEQLGTALQRDIIAGSDNVQVKLASLQQTFQNTLETLGEPLILPVFDLLAAGIPIAESVASVFGSIATAVVPLATGYLQGVSPAFEAIAAAAAEAAPAIEQLAPEFAEIAAAMGEFGVVGVTAASDLLQIGLALAEIADGQTAVFVIEQLTTALEVLAAPTALIADLMQQTLPKGVGEATGALGTLEEQEAAVQAATEAFVASAVSALPQLSGVLGNVQKAGEAFGVLNAASDPATIQANLEAMTSSIVSFTSNIALLSNSGEDLDATLAFFAEAGLEGAPALAALADSTEAERARFESSLEGYDLALENFESTVGEGFGAAGVEGAAEFQSALDSGVGQVSASASATGDAAAQGLSSGFAITGTLVQAQMAIATAILAASGVTFTSTARTVGTQAGISLGQGFISGLGPSVSVAMSVARVQIAVGGIGVAQSARTSGQSIGKALGQGIVSGIGSQVQAISSAAADAVRQAEAAARQEAETGSPSKLFMRIGDDMGMGLVLGFQDAAAGLVREAEAVTFAAAGGVGTVAAQSGSGGPVIDVQVNVAGERTRREVAQIKQGAREGVSDAVSRNKLLFDVGAG